MFVILIIFCISDHQASIQASLLSALSAKPSQASIHEEGEGDLENTQDGAASLTSANGASVADATKGEVQINDGFAMPRGK